MKKLGTPTHLIFWKFLQVFDILGGKIQFSQNILKSWSNVQKNEKNIFHHRGEGGGVRPVMEKAFMFLLFLKWTLPLLSAKIQNILQILILNILINDKDLKDAQP